MPLSDYSLSNFTAGPYTRPVYRRGSGPAVIVIHEVPALHTLVIDFADRLAAAGMRTVACLGEDTYSQPDRFFSYRRSCHLGEPGYGRQLSLIGLRA